MLKRTLIFAVSLIFLSGPAHASNKLMQRDVDKIEEMYLTNYYIAYLAAKCDKAGESYDKQRYEQWIYDNYIIQFKNRLLYMMSRNRVVMRIGAAEKDVRERVVAMVPDQCGQVSEMINADAYQTGKNNLKILRKMGVKMRDDDRAAAARL